MNESLDESELYDVFFEDQKYSIIKYPGKIALYIDGKFVGVNHDIVFDRAIFVALIKDANRGARE